MYVTIFSPVPSIIRFIYTTTNGSIKHQTTTSTLTSCLVSFYWFTKIISRDNRPFPNYLWPLFQSESWCSSFHMKISFHLHVNQNKFSYERMSTKTRLEKEAKGNSEMVYLVSLFFFSFQFFKLWVKSAKVGLVD